MKTKLRKITKQCSSTYRSDKPNKKLCGLCCENEAPDGQEFCEKCEMQWIMDNGFSD